MYLAKAPKANREYVALQRATEAVRERGHLMPPAALRSSNYPRRAASSAAAQGYIYPHDDPRGFEVDCLPDELKGSVFYEDG